MIRKENENKCNRCGELVVTDHKRGRILCTNCGLVKERRFVDPSPEYRYFIENTSIQNDPRRVGNVVNTHLDSQIDLIEIDEGKRSYHIFAVQSNLDKMYTRAIKLIKRYCDLLDIRENIIKQVEEIYYEVQDKRDLRGKKLENIVAACVYLACRRNLVNIQPTALEPIADVSQNKILKTSKIILRFIKPMTIHSSQYADLFCTKLKVNNEHKQDMIKICKDIEEWDFFNKQLPKPRTIAAAVIYFYLSRLNPKFRKPLHDIKEAAGICTDHTIRKYYKDLEDKIEHINRVIGKDLDEYGATYTGEVKVVKEKKEETVEKKN